ncbi:MAG: hypothetical protein LBT42_00055 [Tannerella sp.]|nr:hypothetical protein [Tannerella sp.]
MEDISKLLKLFHSTKNSENPRFELGEVITLIDYFLESGDFENLYDAIEIGKKFYSNNYTFKVAYCRVMLEFNDYEAVLEILDSINIIGDSDLDLLRTISLCRLKKFEQASEFVGRLEKENCDYLEDVIEEYVIGENSFGDDVIGAYKNIQKAQEKYPDNKAIQIQLIINLYKQEKASEALDVCRELLDKDPYFVDLWSIQGRIYSDIKEFDKAIESFDFALACFDSNSNPIPYPNDDNSCVETKNSIRKSKIISLIKIRGYEKALAVFKEMEAESEITDPVLNKYFAECYMANDIYEEAYHIFKKIIKSGKLNDAVIYAGCIKCCLETDRKEEAAELLDECYIRFKGDIFKSLFEITDDSSDSESKDETNQNLATDYLKDYTHNN